MNEKVTYKQHIADIDDAIACLHEPEISLALGPSRRSVIALALVEYKMEVEKQRDSVLGYEAQLKVAMIEAEDNAYDPTRCSCGDGWCKGCPDDEEFEAEHDQEGKKKHG